MRILVTGGLGIVGSGLVKELRSRGHEVVSSDLHHQPDEIGFSLRTDVDPPGYARCDVGEFRQVERFSSERDRSTMYFTAPPNSADGTERTFTKPFGVPTRS